MGSSKAISMSDEEHAKLTRLKESIEKEIYDALTNKSFVPVLSYRQVVIGLVNAELKRREIK